MDVGSELGGYRIEAEIGRGGMGIVYLAEQIRLERKVALKVITPALADDVGFRSRFERESRLAASIDHPNVVPIHEAGERDGLLYIAMRYVRGSDLKQELAHGGLDPARVTGVIGQVAGALDAAHANGLVHRDVKPANILLEQAPGGERAYLTDFGLTKRISSASGVTQSGVFVGTIDYIAPEQLQGGAVDARTDVYALACVLYHALTGRVPYERDDEIAKMHAHANLPPPALLEAAPHVGPAFDEVIRRGMAKRPDDRYASAGDLARAAAAAVHGREPTLAERSVATGAAAPGAAAPGAAAAGFPAPPPRPTVAAPPPPPQRPGPPTSPTTPLPPTPRWAPAPPPERSRTGPLIAVLAVVLLAAGVGAGVLLASGGSKSKDKSTTDTRARTKKKGGGITSTADTPTKTPPGSQTPPAAPLTYSPYATTGYATVLPAGDGWSPRRESVVNNAIYQTKTAGPDGTVVIVDYTPALPAVFKPASSCTAIDHPAFPSAEKCVFRGGKYPQCQSSTCVDYLLNSTSSGPGYAVLVGGGTDPGRTQVIAKRVSDALVPSG
jgi:serine/threonine protein kinase